MEERKCLCREILYNEFGRWHETLVIHLSGCPTDPYCKEYEAFSWWQKLWHRSPESLYYDHLKTLI